MKRFLVILVLTIGCCISIFGQPKFSGTWNFDYGYFMQYDTLFFIHEEKEGELFNYLVSSPNSEILKDKIASIEFVDNELLKVFYVENEDKRYFYDVRFTNTSFAERIEDYFGLVLNNGNVIIGLKATNNKDEFLFIYQTGYTFCIGKMIKQKIME